MTTEALARDATTEVELISNTIRFVNYRAASVRDHFFRWTLRRGLAQIETALAEVTPALKSTADAVHRVWGFAPQSERTLLLRVAERADDMAVMAEETIASRPRVLDFVVGREAVKRFVTAWAAVAVEAKRVAIECRQASLRLVDPGDPNARVENLPGVILRDDERELVDKTDAADPQAVMDWLKTGKGDPWHGRSS